MLVTKSDSLIARVIWQGVREAANRAPEWTSQDIIRQARIAADRIRTIAKQEA